MHPDAILKALRRERDSLDKDAKDFAERVKAIEAEIAANLKLSRPATSAEDQVTVVDPRGAYLAGLKRELERAEKDRHDEIKAEIARVEGLIGKEATVDDKTPSEAEIEQRKQARTGRKVERATAAPGELRGDEQTEKSK